MMYGLGIKISKFVFLGIMPLLLISSSGNKMDLVLNQDISENLIPTYIDFEMDMGEIDSVVKYKKLTLLFSDEENHGTIELVVSAKNGNTDFSEGDFIVQKIDGFLNGFEGVFGYFTHKDFGEKPFFANSGFVKISRLDNNHIQGQMDITLVNDYGRTIRISDTFRNF